MERDVYTAMQDGEPLSRYKKAILGRVHIVVLDPFTKEPDGLILEGNPSKEDELETQIVELWTPKEERFFERMNKKHIDAGRLVKVVGKLPTPPPSPNLITDKEIDVLLGKKFLALKNRLNTFTDEAPVFRLLNRARELDKSEKIIKHIEEKISELQLAAYGVTKPEEEKE